MVPQLTTIVLRSWSEAVFLPVLVVRCRAEWCDEAAVASLWGMVVLGLGGLGLGGLVVAVRHLRYLVQLRKLPMLRVCNLTKNHVGQLIKLEGQVSSRSPAIGPLSQRQVVAFALEVKGKWRKQGLERWKTKTVTRKEREYTAAFLDDGTGQVDMYLEKSLIYWPRIRATWFPGQVPERIFLPQPPDNEYNLVEVSATERHVPHGAHVYVLGKLSDTGRLEARIVGVGTARMARQALLVDILLWFVLAAGLLPLAARFLRNFLSAWSQYLAVLDFWDNPFLHLVIFTWTLMFATGMFLAPIRYSTLFGNSLIAATMRAGDSSGIG